MSKPLLLILVAVLAGVAASVVTFHYLQTITDQERADREMIEWHPHQSRLDAARIEARYRRRQDYCDGDAH